MLSRATRFNRSSLRQFCLGLAGVAGLEADENFICGVLQPCARLVQLPSSLAHQLAELVTIGHMRECPKNQIRTHKVNLLPDLSSSATWHWRYSYRLNIRSSCRPKQPILLLDARNGRLVQKTFPETVSSRRRLFAPVRDKSDCIGECCASRFLPHPRKTDSPPAMAKPGPRIEVGKAKPRLMRCAIYPYGWQS
jgi:hypothetical protein